MPGNNTKHRMPSTPPVRNGTRKAAPKSPFGGTDSKYFGFEESAADVIFRKDGTLNSKGFKFKAGPSSTGDSLSITADNESNIGTPNSKPSMRVIQKPMARFAAGSVSGATGNSNSEGNDNNDISRSTGTTATNLDANLDEDLVLQELSSGDVQDKYEVVEQLGQGSYGSVCKGLKKSSGEFVAIKIMKIESFGKGDGNEECKALFKEIDLLKKSRSKYIVGYHSSFMVKNRLCIIMDFCEAGSVSDLMQATRMTLAEEELQVITACVVLGLEALHKNKIIHRDIKAGNVLLTKDGLAKLADFGVSVQLNTIQSKRDTAIGTPFWMAPEVIQQGRYDELADVWSLGITCIEMADGEPPFSNMHPMRALFVIPKKPSPKVKHPDDWSTCFNDFLSACLEKDPSNRWTIPQLKDHPFLACTIADLEGNQTTNADALDSLRNRFSEYLSFGFGQVNSRLSGGFSEQLKSEEICESRQILMQLVEEALPLIEEKRQKKHAGDYNPMFQTVSEAPAALAKGAGPPTVPERKDAAVEDNVGGSDEDFKTVRSPHAEAVQTLNGKTAQGKKRGTRSSLVSRQSLRNEAKRQSLRFDFNMENVINSPNVNFERGQRRKFDTDDSLGTSTLPNDFFSYNDSTLDTDTYGTCKFTGALDEVRKADAQAPFVPANSFGTISSDDDPFVTLKPNSDVMDMNQYETIKDSRIQSEDDPRDAPILKEAVDSPDVTYLTPQAPAKKQSRGFFSFLFGSKIKK